MSGVIEALHIYDEHNRPILSHIYASRPLSAAQLLPHYLSHPSPRPCLIYLPNTNPPTLLFSLTHANLLFLLTSSSEIEPLLVLEFLHRVIDVFEEFLGAPLLSSKIESSYDIVAQLLNEMCDAGAVSTTEGNALRDLVEVEGWIGKLLAGINIPGKAGFSGTNLATAMPGISSVGASASSNTALPWRRANVRHTSNELYVDLVETLSVTIAPSGRPIAAFANGTIAFTSKISGVPDLLMTLSAPSGRQNIESVMELPVFHPCVRLARWRERPGELSFIPPDGRFVLAGYEVDLLPAAATKLSYNSTSLNLPVNVEVKTSLGSSGADFEVKVFISKIAGSGQSSSLSGPSRGPSGILSGGLGNSNSSAPVLNNLVISVPISSDVRNLSDIRASRGDTTYNPGDKTLEWSIPSKESSTGIAVLRCTVVSASQEDDDDREEGNGFSFDGTNDKGYDYNKNENDSGAYQSTDVRSASKPAMPVPAEPVARDERTIEKNKILMPSSVCASFAVKGWLASGIKVETLTVDTRKSRGVGEGVKPYKGVKYLCVSNGGVEVRC